MKKDFLVISDNWVIHKIPYIDIVYIASKGMRSNIHVASGARYACSKNLGSLCKELDKGKIICRVHTSFAVNSLKIERIQKDKQGLIIMTDGSVVPISKRRKSEFYKKYFAIPPIIM